MHTSNIQQTSQRSHRFMQTALGKATHQITPIKTSVPGDQTAQQLEHLLYHTKSRLVPKEHHSTTKHRCVVSNTSIFMHTTTVKIHIFDKLLVCNTLDKMK